MPFAPHPKRDEGEALLQSGKSVAEVCEATGASEATVHRWKTKLNATNATVEPPDPVIEDEEPGSPTRTKVGGKPRGKAAKAITEKTAQQLAASMFAFCAIMTQEPEWFLTDAEREALAGPLADTLAIVPAPVARMVNTYSAPAILFSTTLAVVNAKSRAIANKKRTGAKGPGQREQEHKAAQGDHQAQERIAVIEFEKMRSAAQPQNGFDPSLAEAISAARGTLRDEPAPGEGHLQ